MDMFCVCAQCLAQARHVARQRNMAEGTRFVARCTVNAEQVEFAVKAHVQSLEERDSQWS